MRPEHWITIGWTLLGIGAVAWSLDVRRWWRSRRSRNDLPLSLDEFRRRRDAINRAEQQRRGWVS